MCRVRDVVYARQVEEDLFPSSWLDQTRRIKRLTAKLPALFMVIFGITGQHCSMDVSQAASTDDDKVRNCYLPSAAICLFVRQLQVEFLGTS